MFLMNIGWKGSNVDLHHKLNTFKIEHKKNHARLKNRVIAGKN
jgi:hypothetical protein